MLTLMGQFSQGGIQSEVWRGMIGIASPMMAQLPKCCALKLHTSVWPIFLERDPFTSCLRPSAQASGGFECMNLAS